MRFGPPPCAAMIGTAIGRDALVCGGQRAADPALAPGDWLSGRAPRSHRGGHWFDPSIAHQVREYIDLRRDHRGSHSSSQVGGDSVPCPAWRADAAGARTPSTSITRGSAATKTTTGTARDDGVAWSASNPGPTASGVARRSPAGTRRRSAPKLAELHDELNDGVVSEAGCSVAQAIRDYLADGLPGRAPKTIRTQREVLEPLLPILGNVPLRELAAADVRSALIKLATTRATRTVSMTHAALARAIRHAEASDKVRRNVAALIDSPSGRQGRPSRSLTFEQAVALITAAREYALYAYVVLSLLVGLRTEEARALRWDHVHLDAARPCPRTSMCGAPYGLTGTSRPASPGAPSHCRRWP